ncbi:MAG: two-component sensor histidine kinase, partial [Nocardioides sp.]
MRKLLAALLALVAVSCAVGAVACTVAVGWSFADALDKFVVSNILIGLGFALCGALIAWHRPTSALGWMYAAGGAAQALSALAAPLAVLLQHHAAPDWLVRLVVTGFQWAWPVDIALIPLSLLLLPDGRLASRRWRPVMVAFAATAPLFVLEVGLGPAPDPTLPSAYLTLSQGSYDSLGWLWVVSELRWVLTVLAGVACLAWRYRCGDETVRRQLLWIVAAGAVIVAAVTPWA